MYGEACFSYIDPLRARKGESTVAPQPNGELPSLQGGGGEQGAGTTRHTGAEEGRSGEEQLAAAATYYDNVYFESSSSEEEEEEEEGEGGDKVRYRLCQSCEGHLNTSIASETAHWHLPHWVWCLVMPITVSLYYTRNAHAHVMPRAMGANNVRVHEE